MRALSVGNSRRAYTLLEIMIIVAMIGLLATLAVPTFIKARKKSQAQRIVNDARIIDSAINSWVLEQNKADGDDLDLTAAALYTKSGLIPLDDVLGNPFIFGKVGSNQVEISDVTKTALSGVPIDWGPY
jgi:type II secretory pathway pseudopilin PulG